MPQKGRVDPEDEITVNDRRRVTEEGDEVSPEQGAIEPEAAAADSVDIPPELEMALRIADERARRAEERAAAAEEKIDETRGAFRRYRDEHDAIRDRLERDLERRVRDSIGRTLERFLAPLDDLDRALSFADDSPMAQGMALVKQRLLDLLAEEGLVRLDVVGHTFDPEMAEAVAIVPADDPESDNVVVEELRAGYSHAGRVLRAAQVRVGKHGG